MNSTVLAAVGMSEWECVCCHCCVLCMYVCMFGCFRIGTTKKGIGPTYSCKVNAALISYLIGETWNILNICNRVIFPDSGVKA